MELPTKHLKALKYVRAFQIELEFGSVGFLGEGETGVPEEKPTKPKKNSTDINNSVVLRFEPSLRVRNPRSPAKNTLGNL